MTERLPAVYPRHIALGDIGFFHLEIDRSGVRIKLDRAELLDLATVSDVTLKAPHVRFPFDYSAGPRGLASRLTYLEALTVSVPITALSRWLQTFAGEGLDELRVGEAGGTLVLSGTVRAVPFTVRIALEASSVGGAVRIVPCDPRLYGRSDGLSWDEPFRMLWARLPDLIRCRPGHGASLSIVRPLLARLLPAFGFKVPVIRNVRLASTSVGRSLVMRFEEGPGADIPDEEGDDDEPEAVAMAALRLLAGRPDDREALSRFFGSALACPNLLSEVFFRAVLAGGEWPEWPSPHIAAILAAPGGPDVPDKKTVLARCCNRLLEALETPAEAIDILPAARLIASVSDRLEASDALGILSSLRSRVAEPLVFEACARAIHRLGRPKDAVGLMTEGLRLAPQDAVEGLLEAFVLRSDTDMVLRWLPHLVQACDEGRFGASGERVRRRALLLLASTLGVVVPGLRDVPVVPGALAKANPSEDPRGGALDILRSLLDRDPDDTEALELFCDLCVSTREVWEAAQRLRSVAHRSSAPARFLLKAARLLARVGLTQRAVACLEEALASAPSDPEVLELLDQLYETTGMTRQRRRLAEDMLANARGDERLRLLRLVAFLAEEEGDLDAAAEYLFLLLEADPMDQEAMCAAKRVLSRSRHPDLEKVVLELSPTGEPMVLEAERAISRGDLDRACELLERAMVSDIAGDWPRLLLAELYRVTGRAG